MSLDFVKIKRDNKKNTIYPDFLVTREIKDLMVRGGAFYAIWDEEKGLWSKDEYDVQRLVDRELREYNEMYNNEYHISSLEDNSSKEWNNYKLYIKRMPDNYSELDRKIIFGNTDCSKNDFASYRLPYNIVDQPIPNYTKLMETLYDPDEREKIEWAIGAIISGDSKRIQKFIVFYGEPGSGKSTVMNIIQMLFEGYYSVFEAKSLASSNNSFALEEFKNNPLIAIQQDGDLSKIEDNTKLNSIISHEKMSVNEKFKSKYEMTFHSFLFMGTNSPVKITDARSGLNRRLIDVHPSNRRLPYEEYMSIMDGIEFELGGIAHHCLKMYQERGMGYYNNYIPIDMISSTNSFYDYICENYDFFKQEDMVSLKTAWTSYKEYVDYARISYPLSLQRFKEEMKAYFNEFVINQTIDGVHLRNTYVGFRKEKIDNDFSAKKSECHCDSWLIFDNKGNSVFDLIAQDYPAQYANDSGTPLTKWRNCTTSLKELATSQLHYVKVPENHIIIDFDLKNDKGEKDLILNIEAASKFPETYAELSKSGNGIHLHYIYDGDVTRLSRIYSEGIEIKVFTGDSSLRRCLKDFVNKQISHINSGLPLKKESKMVNFKTLKNEKALRTFILRNLNKEYHAFTKPSIDFIAKGLEEAYEGGMVYDITDLRPAIQTFALSSSNNADYCLKVVSKMKFQSDKENTNRENKDDPNIIFFDCEVFLNVFILCWKIRGSKEHVRMINPSPREVEALFEYKLVGFNCRNYDNHICYAWALGYTNQALYELSKRIINGSRNGKFREAYNLSYTDVYDYASKKQSLKKWEIELGIHHKENAYPWDEPLAENKWEEVADYCCYDVDATEAVFEATQTDFLGRQILAAMCDGSVNDSTNSLSTKFIFGDNRNPELVYTNLATGEQTPNDIPNPYCEGIEMTFPGYEFRDGKNMFRGEEIGFGGRIKSWPGIYTNVALLDIESMHPTTAIILNYFGKYTKKFKIIKDTRIAIKHGKLDLAKELLNDYVSPEILDRYLSDKTKAKGLAQALKMVINPVYGLSAAKFDNPFRHPSNANNIVALRGALFMVLLEEEVTKRGYPIVAIKTDSIKIANADPEIIQFVTDFGKKYGYNFEHEATYAKMCQINDADYVAKTVEGEWTATGKQFQIPYVFKTLFSHEKLEFEDFCETKEVKSALYLDLNEGLNEDDHNMQFIGRIGSFCPIKEGCGGGVLYRDKCDGSYAAATGTKGYRWLEAETVRLLGREDDIDISYFHKLIDDALDNIAKFGDTEWFLS